MQDFEESQIPNQSTPPSSIENQTIPSSKKFPILFILIVIVAVTLFVTTIWFGYRQLFLKVNPHLSIPTLFTGGSNPILLPTLNTSPIYSPFIPSDWIKESQCNGLIFFHPQAMYFFGFHSKNCFISTVGENITVSSREESLDLKNVIDTRQVTINGIPGKRILVNSTLNQPSNLYYIFYKWGLYYILKADLSKTDYSMQGNLDIYKDYPEIGDMVGVQEASPSSDVNEFIKLIDQIATTISFTSPPPTQIPTNVNFDECLKVASKQQQEAETKLCGQNKKADGSCLLPSSFIDKVYSEYVHNAVVCYRMKVKELKEINECIRKNPNNEKKEYDCYLMDMFPTIF